MKLFCFACRDMKNIPIGLSAGLWAVGSVSDQAMKSRRTKAIRNLKVGDVGLLYCNPLHAFSVPFAIKSEVDTERVVTDVWPEAWVLPFQIEALTDGTKFVSKDLAKQKWSLFQRIPWKGSISATLNFTGTTVFVPTEITQAEWSEIVGDL